MKSIPGQLELIFEIGDHHHFDCMVLRQIVAYPNADFASLASVDGNERCLCGIVIQNGIRFRTELGTKPTRGFTAYGLIDMCN
jgi:hypothetical protein